MPGKLKKPDVGIQEYIETNWNTSFQKKGSALMAVCPFHSHASKNKNLRIWPSSNTYVCSCDQDGGTIWDLISKHEGLPNFKEPGFDETIRHVCNVMGLEPEVWDGKSKDITDVIYAVYREIDKALVQISLPNSDPHYQQDPDRPDRFLYRGVDVMNWLTAGVGMLPQKEARRIANKFGPRSMKAAGIKGWKNNSSWDWLSKGVLMLRKNRSGIPVGLAVRWTDEWALENLDGKYHKNKNHDLQRSRDYLFGYHTAKQAKHCPRVYVVEGEMDTLSLQLRGQGSVVCAGRGVLGDNQVEALEELGKEIVVVTDADENSSGQDNACTMATKYPQLKFIRLPMVGGKPMDPDSFVQQYSLRQFEDLPVETARMVRMLNEEATPTSEGGLKWRYPEATAQKYMGELLESPSAYSMREVEYVAGLSQLPADQMKSWLLATRNQQAVDYAAQNGLPVRIEPEVSGQQ